MADKNWDGAAAVGCLFDPGGELLGVGVAKERIVAAIEHARAEGVAAALADPERVLEAATEFLIQAGYGFEATLDNINQASSELKKREEARRG